MATPTEWNFFNRNVQSGLTEGRYMNAAFTMIAAGPPRLAAITGDTDDDADIGDMSDFCFPIGVVQSFNLGQNSQIMRLFEIGSERSYFIRGRTMGQIGLGRIMYHGPSLLRVLYAYLSDPDSTDPKFSALYDNSQNVNLNTSGNDGSKNAYENLPGHDNLWLDLASDVFSQPIGLMLLMRDSNADTVGAFYLEYCMVTNHGFATDSGGTIITENAALMYERVIPINVDSVAIIANSDDLKDSGVVGNIIGSAV
jgi:hypothetical protein